VFSIFKRHRELFIVSVLLLFPFITYLTRGHKGREPNFVDRTVVWVSSPLARLFTWVCDGIGDGVHGYVALHHAREGENACKVELAQAHEKENALEEAAAENERLRAYVRYAQATPEEEIVARIIGLNPVSQPVVSFRVNRGEDEGVRAGMPVVTPEGVVGKVLRATGAYADVTLLTEPSSKIGVIDQRSRVRGTATGMGPKDPLLFENITRVDDVVEGDPIVTAGSDGVFPPGLKVGRVSAVQKQQTGMMMMMTAGIVPAVDPMHLEEVLVVPVLLSPATESEAAAQARKGPVK